MLWRAFILSQIAVLAVFVEAGPAHAQDKPIERTQAQPPKSPQGLAYEEAKRKTNENVVTIAASGRTTVVTQFAEEISNVIEALPDNKLRVIPSLSRGAEQVINDMLYLRGLDMGIVEQETLERMKKRDSVAYANLEKKIHYITKLTPVPLQIYAKDEIKSLADLRGKKVSCLKQGSSTAQLCEGVFGALNLDAEIVYDDADLAMQKVKNGEIAAAARSGPPPLGGFEKVKAEDGLHFVPISEDSLPGSDFSKVRAAYLPYRLKSTQYPNIIPEGQDVPTVAGSIVLAVYAWPTDSIRYQNLAKFVELFFGSIGQFQKPPRHPGWQDVNLATDVPGWTRFPPAQQWLDAKRKTETAQNAAGPRGDAKLVAAFQKYLGQLAKGGAALSEQQKAALFDEFLRWWDTKKQLQ